MDLQGSGTKVIRYAYLLNTDGIADTHIVKTCDAVKDDLSDLSPIRPSGKHRGPWAARFGGVSRGRHPRRKGKENEKVGICLPCLSFICVITF